MWVFGGVVDVLVGVGELGQERLGLFREGVVGAVVGGVDPPDGAWVSCGGELVEHGEHGSGTDPCGEEDDRAGAFFEYEGSAGAGDVHEVTGAERGMDVAADFPVGLVLDADAVGAGCGRAGQGVTAHCGGGFADAEADGEVLARACLG